MKLAFCLFKYFPFGGLQRDFLRIARECAARGHEIHVYTSEWQGTIPPGFEVHLLAPHGHQNHIRCINFAHQLKKATQSIRYDAVIGFNKLPGLDWYYAADVCYQARIYKEKSWVTRLLPRYRHYLALERAVFNPGEKTRIMLIAKREQAAFMHYYHTEEKRFFLLPPGIDRDRKAGVDAKEKRLILRKSFQLLPDTLLVLLIGSGFKTKGLDRAILALSGLPDHLKARTQLWVIGQDNPQSYLKMAEKLQVNGLIQFLGGRPNIPDFLLAADLLIHPAYHENTGTVLLEALVAGLPVLTVDACGYAPYIEKAHAGQVLASPFSQEALNLSLKNMLISPDREQWRQNALSFAAKADIYDLPQKAADLILDGVAL